MLGFRDTERHSQPSVQVSCFMPPASRGCNRARGFFYQRGGSHRVGDLMPIGLMVLVSGQHSFHPGLRQGNDSSLQAQF